METQHETRAGMSSWLHENALCLHVYMRNDLKLMPAWPRGAVSPDMDSLKGLSSFWHNTILSELPAKVRGTFW